MDRNIQVDRVVISLAAQRKSNAQIWTLAGGVFQEIYLQNMDEGWNNIGSQFITVL